MDLKSGFQQIKMDPEDTQKTAFNTHYGVFKYLVLPIWLQNAPATYQSLTNAIFGDFQDIFMVVYFDDLLIFNESLEDLLVHIEDIWS